MFDKILDETEMAAVNAHLLRARGEVITRVSLDQWSVSLVFADCLLFVEGHWNYTGPSGELLDRMVDLSGRAHFALWRMVGQSLESVAIDDHVLGNVAIVTSNGDRLVACGDDNDFEDWTLTGPGISVVCMGHTQWISRP